MKSSVNSRKFRPSLDRLENLCLLSGGVHGAAMVHALKVVDLTSTTVGDDAVTAVNFSTPHNRRKSINLVMLNADSSTNTISGVVTETYKFPLIGTITTTTQFRTNIDTPNPANVKLTANKFSVFFVTPHTKKNVQRAIINFLNQDHAQIVALLKA